jgi:anti-sigma B factor antagonist
MDSFAVEVGETSAEGRTAVTVRGELDMAEAEHLWSRMEPLIRPGAVVVLDGSGLTFMDSVGLRVVLQARSVASLEGASFRLAEPQPAIQRVLKLAGVDKLVETYPTVAEALAA